MANTGNLNMTMLVTNFLPDPELLNTSGGIRTLDLGALSEIDWQGELTFTSDETGEARDIYTAGEAVTGKMDIHNGEGQGTILTPVKRAYGIGLGCLISADVDGLLLSGRCISMDSPSLGSMRIMPTCMAIGEAAGVCAAHAVRAGVSVRDVPAAEVVSDLLASGAILE